LADRLSAPEAPEDWLSLLELVLAVVAGVDGAFEDEELVLFEPPQPATATAPTTRTSEAMPARVHHLL
jgi:hypothetical protein